MSLLGSRKAVWNLLYLSIAVIVIGEFLQFWVYRNPVRFSGGSDFLLYAGHSEDILRGQAPSMIWKPFGCGAWLAGYRLLFGDNMAGFAVYNSVALGLLPFFAFVFGISLRGTTSGLICALLVAISPACATSSILAETPAAFFLALSLMSVAIFQKGGRAWLAALGAAFLVAAWLCRPDSLVYALGVLALAIRPGRGWTKFAGAVTFVAVAGLLVFAVCRYNKPFYGRALPVRYDSYLRYLLVFDTEKDYHINPVEPAIQEIRKSLLASGAVEEKDLDETNFLGWNRGWWIIRESLKETNGSYYNADQVMGEASMGVIRSNLASFAKDAARTFTSFAVFRPVLGASTFVGFETKPDYAWRRFDFVQNGRLEATPVAEKLYQAIRHAREDQPYNNWNNPYNSRYLRFLSFAPIGIYPALLLLVWTVRRLLRWQILALLASVMLAFSAYATGGFFDYRYLLSHSWALWALAGLGLAAAVELWFSRASRKKAADQPAGKLPLDNPEMPPVVYVASTVEGTQP